MDRLHSDTRYRLFCQYSQKNKQTGEKQECFNGIGNCRSLKKRTGRPMWKEYTDTASGRPYWHNSVTGETTWDQPVAEWEEDDDGESQRNSKLQKRSSPRLAASPRIITRVDPRTGDVVYYNMATGRKGATRKEALRPPVQPKPRRGALGPTVDVDEPLNPPRLLGCKDSNKRILSFDEIRVLGELLNEMHNRRNCSDSVFRKAERDVQGAWEAGLSVPSKYQASMERIAHLEKESNELVRLVVNEFKFKTKNDPARDIRTLGDFAQVFEVLDNFMQETKSVMCLSASVDCPAMKPRDKDAVTKFCEANRDENCAIAPCKRFPVCKGVKKAVSTRQQVAPREQALRAKSPQASRPSRHWWKFA